MKSSEFSVNAAASAIVRTAMKWADSRLTREEMTNAEGEIAGVVEALVDECRSFYRAKSGNGHGADLGTHTS